MKLNQVIHGDCLEVMRKMEANSIDTIITDPPYNLTSEVATRRSAFPGRYAGTKGASKGFMGKQWDGTGISFSAELWRECLRVAKPGATLLCFGGTRTYHRLACAIEDAGWILKDCIMWIYGSGFPKATDISKQMDKMAGKEREVVGTRKQRGRPKENAVFEKNTSKSDVEYITEPATPEAKLWSGWKSHGLKPAYEPILVAMKPNEGSYAQNALKYGVAGLNIDGGRIGYEKEDAEKAKKKNESFKNAKRECIFSPGGKLMGDFNPQGRFPANIILDSEAAKILDEMSGECKSGSMKSYHKVGKTGKDGKMPNYGIYHEYNARPFQKEVESSQGGASRFFKVIRE